MLRFATIPKSAVKRDFNMNFLIPHCLNQAVHIFQISVLLLYVSISFIFCLFNLYSNYLLSLQTLRYFVCHQFFFFISSCKTAIFTGLTQATRLVLSCLVTLICSLCVLSLPFSLLISIHIHSFLTLSLPSCSIFYLSAAPISDTTFASKAFKSVRSVDGCLVIKPPQNQRLSGLDKWLHCQPV